MSSDESKNQKPCIIITDSNGSDITKQDSKEETSASTSSTQTSSQSGLKLNIQEVGILIGTDTESHSTAGNLLIPSTSGAESPRSREKLKVLPLLPEKLHNVLDNETRRKRELSRILDDHEKTLRSQEIFNRRRESSIGTTLFHWDTNESADPVLHIATRLNIHRDSTKATDRLREISQKGLDRVSPQSQSPKSSLADPKETATAEQQEVSEESDTELMAALTRPEPKKRPSFSLLNKMKQKK